MFLVFMHEYNPVYFYIKIVFFFTFYVSIVMEVNIYVRYMVMIFLICKKITSSIIH